MNTFEYVGGNPVSNIDPRGLLSDAAKDCICSYLTRYDFDREDAAHQAQHERNVAGLTQGIEAWRNPNTQACENYLFSDYIEWFYNPIRRHSSCDNMSPI